MPGNLPTSEHLELVSLVLPLVRRPLTERLDREAGVLERASEFRLGEVRGTQVDELAVPLLGVDVAFAFMDDRRQHASGNKRISQSGQCRGELVPSKMDEGIERADPRPPAAVLAERPDVTDLEPGARTQSLTDRDHAGGEIDTDGIETPGSERPSNMTGAASEIAYRTGGRQRVDESIDQLQVARIAGQLVTEKLRVLRGHRVVALRHIGVLEAVAHTLSLRT